MLRLILLIGRSVLRGLKAAHTLLRGAQRIPSEESLYRSYVKSGGYQKALLDFLSVRPSAVYNLKTREVGVCVFSSWCF